MEEIATEILKERIRERMEVLGKNPSSVALEANLSRSAVRDILSGKAKNPGIMTVYAIADALECSHGYLTGQTDNLHYKEATETFIDVSASTRESSGTLEAGVFRLVPPEREEHEAHSDFGVRVRKPFRSKRRYIHRDLYIYRAGDASLHGIHVMKGDVLTVVSDPSAEAAPSEALVIVAHRLPGGTVEELSGRIVKKTNDLFRLVTAPEDWGGTKYPDIEVVEKLADFGKYRTKDGGTISIEGIAVEITRQLDV